MARVRLILKDQEIPLNHPDSRWRFTGRLVATRSALDEYGPVVIFALYTSLQKLAQERDGIDYLQVFEDPFDAENTRLWYIDDETHVTALLPSDY